MVNYLQYIEGSDVIDSKSFSSYCEQRMGIPYPTVSGLVKLRKNARVLFDQYPDASWQTLVRTLDWCLAHKKRYAQVYSLTSAVRFAWRDGYLPELDPKKPVDERLEHQIESALKIEKDEDWRYRLMTSVGVDVRRRLYNAWRAEQGAGSGS